MKFSRVLATGIVPEWRDFYLNYKILKKILSPYKLLGKSMSFPLEWLIKKIAYTKAEVDQEHIVIANYNARDLEKLKKFNEMFEHVIFKELQKVFDIIPQRLTAFRFLLSITLDLER